MCPVHAVEGFGDSGGESGRAEIEHLVQGCRRCHTIGEPDHLRRVGHVGLPELQVSRIGIRCGRDQVDDVAERALGHRLAGGECPESLTNPGSKQRRPVAVDEHVVTDAEPRE